MRFHKGQKVLRTKVGPMGLIASEKTKVSRADRRGVYVRNRRGERSSGPFHPRTGRYPERDRIFGTRQRIIPLPKKVV